MELTICFEVKNNARFFCLARHFPQTKCYLCPALVSFANEKNQTAWAWASLCNRCTQFQRAKPFLFKIKVKKYSLTRENNLIGNTSSKWYQNNSSFSFVFSTLFSLVSSVGIHCCILEFSSTCFFLCQLTQLTISSYYMKRFVGWVCYYFCVESISNDIDVRGPTYILR